LKKMSVSTAQLAPADVWTGRIYNGAWVPPGGGTMRVQDKATGVDIGEVGIASPEDVAAAAAVALDAQRVWKELPGPARGDVLREVSRLVLEHGEEIADQIVRESGSIGAKGEWEVRMTAREILEAAAIGSEPIGLIVATAEPGRQSFARRVPIGVVGVITPWNSPFLLAARAIGPALATGNAVILKPDPHTPICGGVMWAQLLEAAGLPAGLFHVVPGGIPTGEALVEEPLIEMVSFTGSTRAGRTVGAKAGGLLKRVSLELGGNNPYIVLDDADIEAAASAGAWASFFHQGQICLTAGRHIVHERVADDYVDALIEHARGLVIGDPSAGAVHLGPIVNERQAASVDRILNESLTQGAELRFGGSRNGLFFEPSVVTGVKPGMPLFDEEIFGPVAAITTFADDNEAVGLANSTSYGLSAAVVGADLGRAKRIADQLHAGIIHINDQPVLHEVYGPIGGVGVSGNGHNYGAVTNADQFTEWQWVTTRTEMPPYPF
jgi:benzaldehyde dehydrogenase (NAD)